MLVKLDKGKLTTKPIAGTRKRSQLRPEAEIVQELLNDEKENAEHIMLLDLGRNDIGKICCPGTVQVEEFMNVERYSHVYHIVSQVSGRMKENCSPWKALQACFPAGTVSGAPKVRVMQIIESLEPCARGPYAGALGYVGDNGNMDTCIIIRSLFFKEGVASVQAGAGIVYDSNPISEYEETRNKAEAMIRALKMAEGRD
jgi:anthranilate synthase component 1